MNISDNTIFLQDNDIYIIINTTINVDDIYILIEHMLTVWKKEKYDNIINNRTVDKITLFNFFNQILLDVNNIFIVDKNFKPLYYIECNVDCINLIIKTII